MNSFRKSRQDIEQHATRWYSNKQEKQVAKEINGKQQPNSGATMFKPGDVVTENWLLECKTCTKEQKQFTIKREWFDKNKDESILANKEYCAIVFNFGPDTENHYIINETLFNTLKEYLENENCR